MTVTPTPAARVVLVKQVDLHLYHRVVYKSTHTCTWRTCAQYLLYKYGESVRESHSYVQSLPVRHLSGTLWHNVPVVLVQASIRPCTRTIPTDQT